MEGTDEEIFSARDAHDFFSDSEDKLEDSMTSLKCIVMTNHAVLKSDITTNYDSDNDDDGKLDRLSLAYERLHVMPKILLQELAPRIRILDISHNEFDNLVFLKEFPHLTTLICDHNKVTDKSTIPYCPKLEVLWMNHCQIATIYPWARKLQQACPNLKHLSLMGNPAAPSYLNGGNFYEYLQYRYFLISLFVNLVHLDDRPVTKEQQEEAEKIYPRPLIERIITRTQTVLPEYLRKISESIVEVMTPPSPFDSPQRNLII